MSGISTLSDLARYDSDLANNPYLQGLNIPNQSNNNQSNPTTNNKYCGGKPKKKTNNCLNGNNQWIIDLLLERSQKQTGHQYHKNAYTKAIKNIKKCPFPINNEYNAMAIDGIGESIAKLIKQKLVQRNEYVSEDAHQARQNARQAIEKQNKNPSKKKNSNVNNKRKKTKQNGPYVPRTRSGGYALLIHMYDRWKNNHVQGFTKKQLIRDAQQYTDSSFTEKKGEYYTAWSSMTKLINCDYVQKINRGSHGTEYTLLAAGQTVAAPLHAKLFGNPIPSMPDRDIFSHKALGVAENGNGIPKSDDNGNDNKDKFICEYCDKVYQQKGWLDKHVEKKHKKQTNAKVRGKVLPVYNDDNNSNSNVSGRKRSNEDMMELDEDIEQLSKRQRVEVYNVQNRIKINGGLYELCLIYDTSEERRKNRNERIKLENEFNKNEQIRSKPYRLPIGDFCWTLINVSHKNSEYLYPIIVERKRMDDLAKSIQDKRYAEQKWRIKKNLPYFRHIYLIEEYRLESETMKKRVKTALINTQVRDRFLVYNTKSLIQSIRCLAKWTHLIYKQILMKINNNKNNVNYNFFRDEKCLLFEKFNTLTDVKKNLNIPAKILFGRQLMAINGVTDIIASQIVLKYATLRQLYNVWDNCDNEQDEKVLLYNQVNGTCLQWHTDLDSGIVELDEDLRNVCAVMDNKQFKPISKNLSEKIWKALYHDME